LPLGRGGEAFQPSLHVLVEDCESLGHLFLVDPHVVQGLVDRRVTVGSKWRGLAGARPPGYGPRVARSQGSSQATGRRREGHDVRHSQSRSDHRPWVKWSRSRRHGEFSRRRAGHKLGVRLGLWATLGASGDPLRSL